MTPTLNPQSSPSHTRLMSSMPWMAHLTISSCGSAESPLLPHQAPTAAPLPQELPQVREEGAPFPGSRPQGGRLHGHCSEDEAPLVYTSHSTHARCGQPSLWPQASHPGTVKSLVYQTTAKASPVGLVIIYPSGYLHIASASGNVAHVCAGKSVSSGHMLACDRPRKGLEARSPGQRAVTRCSVRSPLAHSGVLVTVTTLSQ